MSSKHGDSARSIDVTQVKPGQIAKIAAARPAPSPELRAAIDRVASRRG
jgi:hypothetical protein